MRLIQLCLPTFMCLSSFSYATLQLLTLNRIKLIEAKALDTDVPKSLLGEEWPHSYFDWRKNSEHDCYL